MGPNLVLTGVGQADDTVLMSNDMQKLQLIFHLALQYCEKFNVKLSPSKTKLMRILPPKFEKISFNIQDKEVEFVDQVEHVGVIRSTQGNMPNIMERITSFKKVLG